MHGSIKTKLILSHIRDLYGVGVIPLHVPKLGLEEKKYLDECIDSNFVSSVGPMVTEFEQKISTFTGSRFAVAVNTGTAALQISLLAAGVKENEEVITQPLTFIATVNAINYISAIPIFVDVDRDTMGMSPLSLTDFLVNNAVKLSNGTYNKITDRKISACIPMHTFGLPCRIKEIVDICNRWGIKVIEDAAESLGSSVGESHTGTLGCVGTLSFNGNKIITTGGGGMIITDDEHIAKRARHLSTTARVMHQFHFMHDEVGYNFRMPNINAALGLGQMNKLDKFIISKRQIAESYMSMAEKIGVEFARELEGAKSNYWLNTLIMDSPEERDDIIYRSEDVV